MKIFLIGLPGSGKTTLGKELAEKLNFPFIDLDAEIEKSEQKSVQKIFEERSENYFRKIEADKLKELSSNKDFVMATGGGAPCFYKNVELMNALGKTIFLNVPVDEIVIRLQHDKLDTRPLLKNANQLKDKLESLLLQRIEFYNKAQFKFAGSKISTEEIISRIKD